MKGLWKWIMLGIVVCSLPLILFLCLDFQTDAVVVAVLDTGVDGTHEWLHGKVIQGRDFIDGDLQSQDVNGHGTHVAGIIANEAPRAKILSVRVIDEKDDVRNSGLAVLYSVLKGADVVNMSFVERENVWTKLAVKLGTMKGVVFVAASGNKGDAIVGFPARYEGVYSVAALDPEQNHVLGNIEGGVSYVAPGVGIESAGLEGEFVKKTGTSMASAYVSGAFAYLKSVNPGMTTDRLNAIIQIYTTSIKVGTGNGRQSLEQENLRFRTIDYHRLHSEYQQVG